MTGEKNTEIRAYHIWELCELYGIKEKAFKAWIKPFNDKIGQQRGKKYTPIQIRVIFDVLGEP